MDLMKTNLTIPERALSDSYGVYLDRFKVRAIDKFEKGIIEHRGQKIEDLDLEQEIENEMIDIMAYNFFKTL